MLNKEQVLQLTREQGKSDATLLQNSSSTMDGTALYAQEEKIPDFVAACEKMNMKDRKAGLKDGFVCKSSSGRVVRLLQNYDSTVYTQEPEKLSAQWGFKWSTDPQKALPFIAISTSPYMTGDCCTENGKTYKAKQDNLVNSPSSYPQGWKEINV